MRHNLENLKKHYEHIKNGKLIHERFDFYMFNSQDGTKESDFCGTAGCSLGESPAWNKDIKFYERHACYQPSFIFKGEPVSSSLLSQIIFGLNSQEHLHLFVPLAQNTEKYGGFNLQNNSTKDQVNENLRIFIEKIESGEYNKIN